MTSSSPPPFVACLACGRFTPLPLQLSTRAVVRCPHCHTQFSLKDLLAEPTATWELVSDGEHDWEAPVASNQRSDARSAAEELEADYTYAEPSVEIESPISPGAKTVEMLDHQTLVEGWQDEDSAEELYEPVADILFDSNRAASDSAVSQQLDQYAEERNERTEEAPPRKLEGPLVGEFSDDPPNLGPAGAMPTDSILQASSLKTAQESFDRLAADRLGGERRSYIPPSQEMRNRKKLSRRSPLWSVLQIALGGLAAIPISLLLIWHLLGTDVGDAAPWVAQYAPWIVPAKFHPYAPANSTQDSRPQSAASANRSGSLPPLATAEVDNSAETPADIPGEFPTVEPRALSELDLPFDAAPNQPRVTKAFSDAEPTLAESAKAESANDEAELSNIGPEAVLPEQASTELAPVDLEPTPLETCFARIHQTEQRLEEWPQAVGAQRDDSNSRSQLATLAHVTYGELTGLALAIDKLLKNDEILAIDTVLRILREQLDGIGQQVAHESEVRRLVEKGSRFWVKNQVKISAATIQDTPDSEGVAAESKTDDKASAIASPVYGLAMTAELDSVMQSEDGHWWLATPTQATQLGEPPLEIRIPRDLTIALPEDTLAKGQSLFLLGTVRRLSELEESGPDETPHAQAFVASYLYPL